jgi:hypothetical protein
VNLSQRRQGAAGSSRCGSKKPSASLRSIPAWITPSAILASRVSSGSRVNSYNVVHDGGKRDACVPFAMTGCWATAISRRAVRGGR